MYNYPQEILTSGVTHLNGFFDNKQCEVNCTSFLLCCIALLGVPLVCQGCLAQLYLALLCSLLLCFAWPCCASARDLVFGAGCGTLPGPFSDRVGIIFGTA